MTVLDCIWVTQRVSYKKQQLHTFGEDLSSPGFLMGSVLPIFLVFCVLLLCVFTFLVPCYNVWYDIRIKTCSICLYLQLFVRGFMSHCVFFVYVCEQWCPTFCSFKYIYALTWKRCSLRLYLKMIVGGLMTYLRYLCLFAYSGVQHIWCCVFVLFVFILCTQYCQFVWIVYCWLPLRLSLKLFRFNDIVYQTFNQSDYSIWSMGGRFIEKYTI